MSQQSKTKYEYDPNTFRLKRLLSTRNNGADILQDLNYTYDPVGNIVEVVDNAQQIHYFSNSVIEPKGMYKYDALYKLKEATGRELTSLQLPTHEDLPDNIGLPNTSSNAMQNYTQQYTYDELGNILQMKSVGKWTRDYFYNSNDNKLIGHTDGTTEYTYDAHGNILTMPHLSAMNWDFKNQLLGATNGTFESFYIYDVSGNRVRKVVEKGNVIEERFYVGDYEVYRKTTSGTLDVERKTVHVSDDQKRIAMVDDDGTAETNRYQIDNHLGSASIELDENGTILTYEEYHPFGTTSYQKHNTDISQKRYRYVGKERDEETGLYYYGARYYASWIGRWTATDPKANKYNEWSPYNYCLNNPIKNIDPDGKDVEVPGDKAKEKFFKVMIETFGKNHGFYFSGDKLFHSGNYSFDDDRQNFIYEKFTKNVVDNKNTNLTINLLDPRVEYMKVGSNYVDVKDARTAQNISNNSVDALIGITNKSLKRVIKKEEKVKSNLATVLWHEIGHIIATVDSNYSSADPDRIKAGKWTVGFENIVRDLLGFKPRSGKGHGVLDANGNLLPNSDGKTDIILNQPTQSNTIKYDLFLDLPKEKLILGTEGY